MNRTTLKTALLALAAGTVAASAQSSDPLPAEDFSLNFEEIKWTYSTTSAQGNILIISEDCGFQNVSDVDGNGMTTFLARGKADILWETLSSAAADEGPSDHDPLIVGYTSLDFPAEPLSTHLGGGSGSGKVNVGDIAFALPTLVAQGRMLLTVADVGEAAAGRFDDTDIVHVLSGNVAVENGRVAGVPYLHVFDVTGLSREEVREVYLRYKLRDVLVTSYQFSGSASADKDHDSWINLDSVQAADPADHNGDGVVNISDLFSYINAFTSSGQ
ncbi:MAG: hypothetical protein AAGI17_06580 [Planctomycetota bacterium]